MLCSIASLPGLCEVTLEDPQPRPTAPTNDVTSPQVDDVIAKGGLALFAILFLVGLSFALAKCINVINDQRSPRDDASDVSEFTRGLLKTKISLLFNIGGQSKAPAAEQQRLARMAIERWRARSGPGSQRRHPEVTTVSKQVSDSDFVPIELSACKAQTRRPKSVMKGNLSTLFPTAPQRLTISRESLEIESGSDKDGEEDDFGSAGSLGQPIITRSSLYHADSVQRLSSMSSDDQTLECQSPGHHGLRYYVPYGDKELPRSGRYSPDDEEMHSVRKTYSPNGTIRMSPGGQSSPTEEITQPGNGRYSDNKEIRPPRIGEYSPNLETRQFGITGHHHTDPTETTRQARSGSYSANGDKTLSRTGGYSFSDDTANERKERSRTSQSSHRNKHRRPQTGRSRPITAGGRTRSAVSRGRLNGGSNVDSTR